MTAAQQNAQPRHLTPQELAALIKATREMRQWSQEQLADIAGLSSRTVQRVEEGYTDKHFVHRCPHHKLKSNRLQPDSCNSSQASTQTGQW